MAGRLISVVAELDLFVSKYFMHARWLVRAQVRNKKPIMFIRFLSNNLPNNPETSGSYGVVLTRQN